MVVANYCICFIESWLEMAICSIHTSTTFVSKSTSEQLEYTWEVQVAVCNLKIKRMLLSSPWKRQVVICNRQHVCMPISPSLFLPMSMSFFVFPSLSLSLFLADCLSVSQLYLCLFVSQSLFLSVCVPLSLSLSLSLSISVHLSVCQRLWSIHHKIW